MAETEGVVTFSPGAAAEEWERHVEDAEEGKTDEPKELPLIDKVQAQSVEGGIENQQEILLRANDLFHQRSIEEINDRYGNSMAGKIRAFFAGEYSDLAKAEKLGRIYADDPNQALELFSRSRHFDVKEGLGRLGKVFAKTSLTGGAGALIATGLGGAIASPAFLGALAGGALARAGVEVWRSINPKEREARARVLESRMEVFAEAAKLQTKAEILLHESQTASPEQRQEINRSLEEMRLYLVDFAHYESFRQNFERPEDERQESFEGLAKVAALTSEKSQLEKKREKIADLAAAGGAILGGIFAPGIQSLLSGGPQPEHLKGFMADFDKDTVSHFVDKISPNDVTQATSPEFLAQLKESGGYVFRYSAQEIANTDVMSRVTEAVLTDDGTHVHVLNGMNESVFRHLSLLNNPELAKTAAISVGGFVRDALPQAAANLMFMLGRLGGMRPAERTQEISEPEESPEEKVEKQADEQQAVEEKQDLSENDEAKEHPAEEKSRSKGGLLGRIFNRSGRTGGQEEVETPIVPETADEPPSTEGEKTASIEPATTFEPDKWELKPSFTPRSPVSESAPDNNPWKPEFDLTPDKTSEEPEAPPQSTAWKPEFDLTPAENQPVEDAAGSRESSSPTTEPESVPAQREEQPVPIRVVSSNGGASAPEQGAEERILSYEHMLGKFGISESSFEKGKELKFRDEEDGGNRGQAIQSIKSKLGIDGDFSSADIRIKKVERDGNDATITFGTGDRETTLLASKILNLGLLKR